MLSLKGLPIGIRALLVCLMIVLQQTGCSRISTVIGCGSPHTGYSTENISGNYDIYCATPTGLPKNPEGSWKDLTANHRDAFILGSAAQGGWAGSGNKEDPFHLLLNEPNKSPSWMDLGTDFSRQAKIMFSMWIAPSSISDPNAVILGNAVDNSYRGFSLYQVSDGSGALEIVVGQKTSYRYSG